MTLRPNYSRIVLRRMTNVSSNAVPPNDSSLYELANLEIVKSRLKKASTIRPPNNELVIRRSAVLVPLIIHNSKPAIVFTVRANHLTRHRGELSFPGGSLEEIDENDHVKAALRETQEEIGLHMNDVHVLGELPPTAGRVSYVLSLGTIVIPVLGLINGKVDITKLTSDSNEVAEILASAVEHLCEPANQSFTQYRNGYSLPIFYSETGHRIWGLTAIILHQVLRALVPNYYRPRMKYLRAIKLK